MMKVVAFRGRIPAILVVVVASVLATARGQTWESAIVHYGTDGRLVYARDQNGNGIPDFSYAGYRNGAVPIPTVPVVDSVSVVAGDNTTNIQNAINRVASRSLDTNGFRGALLIKAGTYRVAGTLLLNASGVVLRGVGEGSDSLTNTIIFATGDSVGQPTVLIAGGGNTGSSGSAWSGSLTSNVNIVTDSVRVGDRTFQVADASPFSVGDNIVIYHPKTTAWLRAINWGGVPNDTGVTSYWANTTLPIKFNRFITAIDGNSITIDAPVFAALVRSLSQSYIYKTDRIGIRTNIGIENLRVDNNNPFNQPSGSDGDESHHAQDAIWLGKIEDAWVRHCTTLHFVRSGFQTSIATRVTIDSCSAIDPISIIDGGRRYNFCTYHASQLILFSNCYARYSRHAYVSNGTSTVSGIVFHNCTSEESFNASEGHRLWSQGLLYDNYREINTNVTSNNHVLGLYNRGDMGSGHGWAAVHSVAWKCSVGTSNIIIQQPPTAQNYGIGCFAGQVTGSSPPAPFDHPEGYVEGTNQAGLNPPSLYLAQRTERLGPLNPQYTIIATAGAHGTISPGGVVTVNQGASQTFTIMPAMFYAVDSVLVDDVRVDSTTGYTFVNVTANHTIRAAFRMNSTATLDVPVAGGWNLVSNPVGNPIPGDSVRHLYPTSLYPYAFEFTGGAYVQRYILANGMGYWEKFPAAISQPVTGTPRTVDSVSVLPGWNILGTISCTVDTSAVVSVPAGLRGSQWFGYDSGYTAVNLLVPGKGYWVKANAAGSFVLPCLPIAAPIEQASGTGVGAVLNSLTIIDSRGGAQTLYFGADENNTIPVSLYAMPPKPPAGAFDARFSATGGYASSGEASECGSMVQTHDEGSAELTVAIQSDAYPVTVSWNVKDRWYELTAGAGIKQTMSGRGTMRINNRDVNRLFLKLIAHGQLPKDFALSQNYPNPFNPTTTIRYQLPIDSHVSLRLFNVLGQEVATLVNEEQKAGYKSVEWNASGFPSGVYFCRLESGTRSALSKLMVLE